MRDATLLASGKCARSFQEECRGLLPELICLWVAHQDDSIYSVRTDSATFTSYTCSDSDSSPDVHIKVRDAALLASGKCARSFPEECRGSLPELFCLWTAHLDDNIYSVRADAAIALGDALRAYGLELLDMLLPLLRW